MNMHIFSIQISLQRLHVYMFDFMFCKICEVPSLSAPWASWDVEGNQT